MLVKVKKDLIKVTQREFCKLYRYSASSEYYTPETNLNISFGMYSMAGRVINVISCKEDKNWYIQAIDDGNRQYYWHKNWLEVSQQLEFDF